MFPTGVPGQHRTMVLLSLFGLWVGTAIVVLGIAVHTRSFHMRSWAGVWLSGLTAALVVLATTSLQHPAAEHDRHAVPRPEAIPVAKGADTAEQLRIILDHLPTSFLLMDRDRRILAASANFERITGRDLNQVTGRHCTRSLWSDGFCVGCPSQVAGRSGRPAREVVQVPGPDGAPRFLEHLSVPITTDGEPTSILEVVTDVTDRQSLQDGMVKAERLSVAGEMASVVTHEMRNSLTSVKMILQLLQEWTPGEEGTGELVGVALNSLHHAEGVLNDLLQFAGPAPLRPHEFDPVRMVREAVNLVRPHLEERHIDLSIEAQEPSTAWGDPEQLKTAILNLVLNASQAVESGGSIVLRCRHERLASDPQDFLLLEVEDSGPGVPGDLAERVFDPFFTTKTKGTGLGLPMVKRIVNAHRGTVTLRNLDPGCRFSILLPAAGREHA